MGNQQRKGQTKNIITLTESIVQVQIVHKTDESKSGIVLLDAEDSHKLTHNIRISGSGYAVLQKKGYFPLHNEILGKPSPGYVVDHINGDKLDNRKHNLRILSVKDNANNRTRTAENNTGVVGIIRKEVGGYVHYRATVSDRVTPMVGAQSKTRQISKHFNISKLGEDEAFRLAVEWLKIKREEFGYV